MKTGMTLKKRLYVYHVKGLNPYSREYYIGYFVRNEYSTMWYDEEGHTVCFNENVDYYFPINKIISK